LTRSIDPNPGTYVLILQAEKLVNIQVGRLGKLQFLPGFYLYCGSARGPGGVKARVDRHLRKQKKHHWHIDYLTSRIHILDVWYSYSPVWNECRWAEIMMSWTGHKVLFPGFGSSDCRCDAHLVYSDVQPTIFKFKRRAVQSDVKKSSVEEILSTAYGS